MRLAVSCELHAIAATAIDAQGRPRYTDHADDSNFSLSFKPSASPATATPSAPRRETHPSQRRLKFAIEFAAIGQQEIEGWLMYFEEMDVNELGAVSSKEVLDYLGFRDSKFMHAAFQLLGEPWDGSRMDFGETVKCIAQFCMFGKDELLHFAYQIFDADDNGWISHEEFILLLSDLHPSTNRGRTTRALREIDLLDDGKLEYWEYLELNRRFPNLFYPVVEAQDKMRQKFFGNKHWHRKLKKYQKIKAGIRRARKNNTDKMMDAENRGKRRLQKRERRLAEARAKAQATKSTLKKTILNAQIWALKVEGRWDTGGKKKIKAKKVGQL